MEPRHPTAASHIEILTTGGTFDTLADGSIGAPQAASVLDQARATLTYSCRELMRLDSSLMTDIHRAVVCRAVMGSPYQRMVIIHGTDTLLQTAAALAEVKDKVVVLTGSFTPALAPQGDAAFNLGAALLAAQLLPPGVHLVIGGEYFKPEDAHKDTVARRFKHI